MDVDSPETGVAMEIPVSDSGATMSSCKPVMPMWLQKRLSEPRTPPRATVEEIEAKLRDADLRRQKFYENITSKARLKTRTRSQSSSPEDDLGQRLKAKLLAAEVKRLSILNNSQMRLAKLNELKQATKVELEMRFKRQSAELGTKVEMRAQQAEANRLLILQARHQRKAILKERGSQSLMQRMARESKYRERVRDAIYQKRAAAEKKRFGLLEAEKRRARALALQVQKASNSISNKQEIETNEIKDKLEARLKRVRRKGAEDLMPKGKPPSTDQCSLNPIHEQADTLSRKLSRCWSKFRKLKKTTACLAEVYNKLNINERSVKSMPFDLFAFLIESASTLRITKSLLDRLESRYKLSRAIGSASIPSSYDNIDHLLKRVALPKRKKFPRKAMSSREGKMNLSPGLAPQTSAHLSRYQARTVLSAYMIVGHPDAVISGRGERETGLVNSAGKFVQELEWLIKIILNGPVHDSKSDHELGIRRTFRLQLVAFDSAWCSFLNSFVVWKATDARSLEEDLVRAACRLELSKIQTCKVTPYGISDPLSFQMTTIQKQVSEDLKLLKEKVLHLSGEAGVERMENALSETQMKFFNAKENTSLKTPSAECILLDSPVFQPPGSSDEATNFTTADEELNTVERSLFMDAVSTMEINSSTSSNSISHSSGENLEMKNLMIVNECVHGEHLAFTDNLIFSSALGNDMEKLKRTMEKAFWDGIVESVKQDEPNYSRVVELLSEARDEICAMAPRSWKQEILETIDLEILTQVLNSGRLDIDYLGKILESALIMLQKLSAPVCGHELKRKHQEFMKELAQTSWDSDTSRNSLVIALITGMRFVLEQIQELKQEISKARIRIMEPFLKGPMAFNYLGKHFTKRYGQPSNASIALPLTAKWLFSERDGKDEEWNEHKLLVSELMKRHESSSSPVPSATLRTGGSLLVKTSGNQTDASSSSASTANYRDAVGPHGECKGEEIDLRVRLGLIKLVSKVASLTESELPETMNLNLPRLRRVQSEVQKIIVIATSLLVLRQTLLSQLIVTSQSQMESILSTGYKQLSELLDSSSDAGTEDIIRALTSGVEDEEDNLLGDVQELQPVRELMARMLSKSLQEDDPVFTRVSGAVYLATRGFVLGGTGEQGKELAEMALQKVGASLLIDKVVQAASVLALMAKVSVLVHHRWYANLAKE